MIIVDRALRDRAAAGRPIRVGVVGAGAMGRAITKQIITAVPGMVVVAISNRHVAAANTPTRRRGRRARQGSTRLRTWRRRLQAACRPSPTIRCSSVARRVLTP